MTKACSKKKKKWLEGRNEAVQFSSVTQLCPILCKPMTCTTPGFPVHHQLLELTQTHVHPVSDAINHLILCRPLLLLPSIFPSIRVFTNESALHIRWAEYWSFSFSISPSNVKNKPYHSEDLNSLLLLKPLWLSKLSSLLLRWFPIIEGMPRPVSVLKGKISVTTLMQSGW